jgi:hypothetical protein
MEIPKLPITKLALTDIEPLTGDRADAFVRNKHIYSDDFLTGTITEGVARIAISGSTATDAIFVAED